VGIVVEEQDKDEVQRWTTKRKAALVLSIVRGETSIQEAARQHALTVAEIEDWKERFFLGAENALRAKPKDDEALREEQIKKLKQKIGDLVMDIDILREAAKRHPPTPGTSEQ
jgi:transposase-like protein